jgi:hypothetical protein
VSTRELSVPCPRLTYVEKEAVLARLLDAQRSNAALAGEELVAAATEVAQLARRHRAVVVADGGAGERLVGAALALRPRDCRPADVTARYDGAHVLLVSGMIAAPHALIQTITRLRALGAGAVHVAVLGGWPEGIAGAASVSALGPALSATTSAA